MSSPDPYRDELRAAQDRIALLEEKLSEREGGEDEGEQSAELTRLRALRRAAVRWMRPRAIKARALTAWLVGTVAASPVAMAAVMKTPHPNLARAAVGALLFGVVVAAVTFFFGVSNGRPGVDALDAKIAAEKRRLSEARGVRALEQELRAAREAREATGGARIAVEPEEGTAEDEDEAPEAPRRQRTSR